MQLTSQNGTILVNKVRYTVTNLRVDLPDEDACLEWLVHFLYPKGITCNNCNKITKHHRVTGRKVYACQQCGKQISPMAHTIFHKSRTPLTVWFHAIYLMSTTKAGTSAKEIERQTGVTYKTAWRMMHQIRSMMDSTNDMFQGDVEVDETYVHANTFKRSSARRRYGVDARRTGSAIFGIVHRQSGHVKVWHVLNTNFTALYPLIKENVGKGSTVHSDGYGAYTHLPQHGYRHKATQHGKRQWVDKADTSNYTQNIENVWSHFKRGIKGVYRSVSVKYVQAYADEYAWRYSHRNDVSMFWSLMGRIKKN